MICFDTSPELAFRLTISGAGAASAGNIVRSLSATSKASRPSTAKSVAWSDEVEEQKKKEEAEAEAEAEKKRPAGGTKYCNSLVHASTLDLECPA